MSRTNRYISFRYKKWLIHNPEDCDPRNSYQNGYDNKPRSRLATSINDFWKEDIGPGNTRRYWKRRMSKYYRKVGKREIVSQLDD
jgi:hypothetical protein